MVADQWCSAVCDDDLTRDAVLKRGMLAISVLQAEGLADNTRFGAIDSYIKFTASMESRTWSVVSAVVENGGACPKWRNPAALHLAIDPSMADTEVQVSAWSKDKFDDDLLANGACAVNELVEFRQPAQIWVPLRHRDQPQGRVLLEVTYYPTHPEYLFFVGGKSHDWESTGGLVERYDPVVDEWTASTASLPSQCRDSTAAVNLNGLIYVAGGLTPAVSATVERYDVLRDRWSTVASLGTARHGLALVAVGGYIYAVGGSVDLQGNGTSVVERYDPSRDEWCEMAAMSTERRKGCAAAALEDGCIYVLGGEEMDMSAVPPRREVTCVFEKYSPVTNTWETLPQMPTPRSNLGAAGLGGYIYAIGGCGAGEDNIDSASYDIVERFHPSSNQWEPVAPLGHSRSKLSVAVVGGKIYAVGGHSHVADEGVDLFFNSVERYDMGYDAWQAMAPMAVPRCLGAASNGSA